MFPQLLIRDLGYSGQEKKVFQASHEFALLPRYTNRLNLSQKKGVPTWYTPGLQSFLKTYSEVTIEKYQKLHWYIKCQNNKAKF